MVTDNQVRRLFRLMESEKSFGVTAAGAGMDEKTARKYRRLGELPSKVRREQAPGNKEVRVRAEEALDARPAGRRPGC